MYQLQFLFVVKELDDLFQVLCSVNFQVIYNSGFPCILPGYDDSFKTEVLWLLWQWAVRL